MQTAAPAQVPQAPEHRTSADTQQQDRRILRQQVAQVMSELDAMEHRMQEARRKLGTVLALLEQS